MATPKRPRRPSGVTTPPSPQQIASQLTAAAGTCAQMLQITLTVAARAVRLSGTSSRLRSDSA